MKREKLTCKQAPQRIAQVERKKRRPLSFALDSLNKYGDIVESKEIG